jgi:hypothetical protein
MKKVFACIVVVAILIVSSTSSASLSHAFARSESVSFGIEAENIIFISRGDGAYIRESYYFKVCADHTGSNTLGDIMRTAITKYVAKNDFSDKRNLVTLFEFVLLGDPALELGKCIHKTD